MKTNELRIGNIVKKDNIEYITDFITIQMANNYEPILLTKEWLMKAGFKRFGANGSYYIYGFRLSILLRKGKYEARMHASKGTAFLCHIKYIHELQNLYFTLIGKELKIK